MITKNAAKILRVNDNYGIEVGHIADLNVIAASNIQEAFRLRADRKYVIKKRKYNCEKYEHNQIQE